MASSRVGARRAIAVAGCVAVQVSFVPGGGRKVLGGHEEGVLLLREGDLAHDRASGGGGSESPEAGRAFSWRIVPRPLAESADGLRRRPVGAVLLSRGPLEGELELPCLAPGNDLMHPVRTGEGHVGRSITLPVEEGLIQEGLRGKDPEAIGLRPWLVVDGDV